MYKHENYIGILTDSYFRKLTSCSNPECLDIDTLTSFGISEHVHIIPEPTTEQLIQNMTFELEKYYDTIAQIKRYDNRLTCALRAGYAGVFQSEGIAFAIWMDNCNAYGYQVIEDCMNQLRTIPTPEELIAELPVAPW